MPGKETQTLTVSVEVRDQLTKAMKKMGGSLTTFKSKGTAAFKKVGASVTSLLSGPVARLTAVLGAGVLFASAFNGARDFAGAMSEVSTIAGEAADNMGALKGETKDLATRLGVNEVETAGALYQTLSAGITETAEAFKVVEQASRVAIGGSTDTASAVDLLTSAINAYGLEASDAEDVADTFFKTVELGKTTIAELAGSFGKIGPLSAQLGVSLEEVTGAIAAITLTGSSTGEAVTQIVAAMNALLLKSVDINDLFEKKLNRTFKVSDIRSRGLVAVLEDLREATGGSEAEMIKMVGSVEALNGLLKLTGDSSENVARIMDGMADKAGAAGEAFEKRLLDPFNVMEAQINAIKVGLSTLGGDFVAAFSGNSIKTVADFERQMISIRKSIEDLAPIAQAVGKALRFVADSVAEVSALVDYRNALKENYEAGLRGADLFAAAQRDAARKTTGEFLELNEQAAKSAAETWRRVQAEATRNGDILTGPSDPRAAGYANGIVPSQAGPDANAVPKSAVPQVGALEAAIDGLAEAEAKLNAENDQLYQSLISLEDKYEGQREAVFLASEAELDRLDVLLKEKPELAESILLNAGLTEALRDGQLAAIDAAEATDKKRAADRAARVEARAYEEEVRKLNEALEASKGFTAGFSDGFDDAVNQLNDSAANGFHAAQDSVLAVAGAFSNFFQSLSDKSLSASQKFKAFASDIGRSIQRILSDLLAANIVGGIGSLFGGGGGSVPNLVGGFGAPSSFQFANGGIAQGGFSGAMPVHGYANGGPIFNKPHVAVIGEGKYNEAAVPLPDGRRIPVEMRGGGGSVTNNISPTVQLTLQAPDAATGANFLAREGDMIASIIAAKIMEGSQLRSVIGSVGNG